MLKNCLTPALVLLLALLSTTAHAFIDLPYITPPSPLAGEPITVNVRSGVCDAVLSEQELSREGNAIHVVFFGVRYFNSELCNIPPGLTDFVLGTYPVGTYTLQVDLRYFGVTGTLVTETIGTAAFTVGAAPTPAVSVSVNDPVALLMLVVVIVGLSTCRLRARGVVGLMIACVSISSAVRAQDVPVHRTVEVLLTTAPGAPTAEDAVAHCNRTPFSGRLQLRTLSLRSPQQVRFLLPLRASGDTLVWLPANLPTLRAQRCMRSTQKNQPRANTGSDRDRG